MTEGKKRRGALARPDWRGLRSREQWLKAKAESKGWSLAVTFVFYFLLAGFGFVYLYPILYMAVISLMPTQDLINPTIRWIPTRLELSNFRQVWTVLEYPVSLATSAVFSTVCALLQTLSCALMGYALARYPVPLKRLWVFILVLVFIIPANVVTIPRYVLFNNYHLIGSPLSMILPAGLGQGLKSSIFVLIFLQAFSSYPRSFDEAAQLDGAGRLRVFFRIALPMAVPVIVLSLLFSMVWYWNDTAQTGMYAGASLKTLPLQLQSFDAQFGQAYPVSFGDEGNRLNERYQMAATILVVAPLVLFYLLVQKQFVKGIESAGVTGE